MRQRANEELIAKAITLWETGQWTYQEIGEYLGCSHSSVWRWVSGSRSSTSNVELLTDAYKIKLLRHIEELALLVLDVMPDKIVAAETSLKDLNAILDNLITKSQLLRGAATQSIEISDSSYKDRLQQILTARISREDTRNRSTNDTTQH